MSELRPDLRLNALSNKLKINTFKSPGTHTIVQIPLSLNMHPESILRMLFFVYEFFEHVVASASVEVLVSMKGIESDF